MADEIEEELTDTELTPMEFVALAKEEGWDPRDVALLLRPPMMETPFQCGKWWVTLVER